MASRPFRKRDDVRHRVPLRHTITPTDSSTFLRVSLSPFRYQPCRNKSRNEFTNGPFEDRPTTRLGLPAFNHDPTRAKQLWTFEKLTGIEVHTYYQFLYCSIPRARFTRGYDATSVSFMTSRFGSVIQSRMVSAPSRRGSLDTQIIMRYNVIRHSTQLYFFYNQRRSNPFQQ